MKVEFCMDVLKGVKMDRNSPFLLAVTINKNNNLPALQPNYDRYLFSVDLPDELFYPESKEVDLSDQNIKAVKE